MTGMLKLITTMRTSDKCVLLWWVLRWMLNKTFVPPPLGLREHWGSKDGRTKKSRRQGEGSENTIYWARNSHQNHQFTEVDACTRSVKEKACQLSGMSGGGTLAPYHSLRNCLLLPASKNGEIIAFSCIPTGDLAKLHWTLPIQWSHR